MTITITMIHSARMDGMFMHCVYKKPAIKLLIHVLPGYYTGNGTILHIPSNLYYKTHQISTLERFSYCLAAVLAESIEARCQVENEYVVAAAPTGDAPTTSVWSTILLPTKVRLKLEVLRYYSACDALLANMGNQSRGSTKNCWYQVQKRQKQTNAYECSTSYLSCGSNTCTWMCLYPLYV